MVDSTKIGIERNDGSGENGRNCRYYPDGKRNRKTNTAVIFRKTDAGFNGCPDEKGSEIRIACAICKMSRDVSTIVPMIKKIGNKVIIALTSYLVFSQLSQHKRDRMLVRRPITIISSIRFQLSSNKNRSKAWHNL